MVWAKLYTYNIIIWLIISPKLSIQAEEKLNDTQISSNETQIFPGIKFLWTDDEVTVYVKIQDLLQGIFSVLFFLASKRYLKCISLF